MATLNISQIKSLNKKSSDIDIPVEVATDLKNFSINKREGAATKFGAYADAASSLFGSTLPASITWKNIGELSLTSPSNTDIYLLHGQDGSSNNHLWVGKYWDGAAFQSGFIKLTEAEGIYTADTATNQTLTDSVLSATDSYYVGWTLIINIAASSIQTAAIVTAYNGSTKTLTVPTGAITGAATGDTYYLSRWPLRSGALPTVDDIIRFAGRENAVIGMAGNQSQWPSQFSIWYGYVNRTYGIMTTKAINNFYLDIQPLLKPYVTASPPSNTGSSLSMTTTAGGSISSDGAHDGAYTMYAAYVYDGYQIGPLSDGVSDTIINGITGQTLTVVLTYPIETCYRSADGLFYRAFDDSQGDIPTNYAAQLLSRRVTAVRLYLSIPDSVAGTIGDPRFWREYTLSDASADNNEVELISSTQLLLRSSSITITSDPTVGNTYTQDVGQDGSELKPNFKYGVALDDHFIVAGIRTKTGERKNNNIIASVVDGAGVATPDNFGGSNVINLGFYGAKQITGIKVVGDTATTTSPKRRLGVFTDDDTYILTLTTGSSFDFALDRVGEKEGVVAPDSIVSAEGLIFGVSRNGFRVFTEQGSKIIGEGLKTDFDALTSPAEAVGAYFKKLRMVLFCFPTDQKYYAVNLLDPDLGMFEMNFAHVMRILLATRTGDLYSMSTSAIYQQESGSTQAGTAITPVFTTKMITAKDFFDEQTGVNGSVDAYINPRESLIRYKSVGSAITLTATYNQGTQTVTFPNLSLPAQSGVNSVRFRWPMGIWAKDLQLTFTLSSAQAATNTAFIFESFKLIADLKRRID